MPDFNPDAIAAGLQQLKAATPTQQNFQNPYSTLGTTRDSNFLQGLTYDRNPEYIKAVNQGFLSSMGNAVAQTAVGIPLEIAEGIGYLGVGDIMDKVAKTEQDFGNSFSNKMREWNEQFKQNGAPVYTTPDDQGFKPWDYKWWATNAPSIASAISLLIPATGAVKGIGKLGKAIGGLNAAKKLGITTEALNLGETIAMAGVSRHMEGMMEGMETYQTLYDQAKAQGKSDEEASKIGAEGATETYNKNWPLIATDILQFGMAFKSFNQLSRIKSFNETAKKAVSSTLASKLLTQAGTEAGEEGYQYIVSEEAKRRAAITNKLEPEDYTTYPERLMKYVSSGDFWTSAFIGGLGGAAFEGVAARGEGKNVAKQEIIDNAQKSAIEKSVSIYRNDPIAFTKSTDTDLGVIMLNAIQNGRADKVEEFLNQMKEGKYDDLSEEDKKIVNEKANIALDDLKYMENVYNNIYKDPTKANTIEDQELIRFELANRYDLRSNKRILAKLEETQTSNLATITNERGLTADYSKLLRAQTELEIIKEDLKDKDVVSKEIKEAKIKSLEEEINFVKGIIKQNGDTEEKINEKLNINKSALRTTSFDKVVYDLKVDQVNKDYDELQTQKGRDKISEDVSKFKNKQIDKAYNDIVNQITPDADFKKLSDLKDTASSLNKLKEFTEEYNKRVIQFKQTAPKFSPNVPAASLTDRWQNRKLLQEHETAEISKLALKTGGLPENTDLNPDSIGNLYTKNPAFSAAVNQYFAKSQSLSNIPENSDTKKQSTSSNPQDINNKNGEALKEKPASTNNKSAWNLQGVQFEMTDGVPDINKPATSNVAKKINWEFLNQGKLPLDATLHFEYDFEDDWNKTKAKGANDALFELVYYVDGSEYNKQSSNRIVVGVLSSYSNESNYESIAAKQELNYLRSSLYNTVQASGSKTGTITLNRTAKIDKIIGGRFWNTKEFKNPKDVLKSTDKFVLAIGRKLRFGNEIKSTLDTNGHEWQDRITYSNVTPGSVYLLTEAPSGDILPYKLFTKKVKEIENLSTLVATYMRQIGSTANPEEKKSIMDDLNTIASVKKVNFFQGKFYITLGDIENPATLEVADADLEKAVGDLVVQIDVNKINKGDYNDLIAKEGYITTDLNVGTFFHSTKVAIKPVLSSKVETKAKDTTIKNEKNFPDQIKTLKESAKRALITTKNTLSETTDEDEVKKLKDRIENFELIINSDNILIGDYTFRKEEYKGVVINNKPISATGDTLKGVSAIRLLDSVKTNPTPQNTVIAKTAPNPIKGIGKTSVTFGQGNPKHKIATEEAQYTPLNESEVRNWFNKNLPQVKVDFTPNLIEIDKNGGRKAWGKFYESGILLYNGAPKGVEHHEAFHAVFNLALNDQERTDILKEAKGVNTELTDSEAEEILADNFIRYVQQNDLNDITIGSKIRNFFRKLYDFFKSVFTNDINVETLFQRINNGYYKDKKLATSDITLYKISGVNPYTVKRNIDTLNYYFFQALNEYKDANSLGDLDDVSAIKKIDNDLDQAIFSLYGTVYNGVVEARDNAIKNNQVDLSNELLDLLEKFIVVENGIVTGKGDYYMLAVRDLSKYGIKLIANEEISEAYDSQTDEKQFEIVEEEEALEGWQVKALEVNGKDTLSFNVRKTLRQTTEYELNDNGEFEEIQDKYGFKKFVNFDEIYNYIESHIADTFDADQMIDKLNELMYHKPEIYGIVQKLEKDEVLKTQFFTNFSKAYIPYMQIIQRNNRYRDETGNIFTSTRYSIYNANRKNLSQLLIDEWNSNLNTPGHNSVVTKDYKIDTIKAKAALKEFDDIISIVKKSRKVNLDLNNKLSDILLKFGVNIPAEVLQKEFVEHPVNIGGKIVQFKAYDNYIAFVAGNESIRNIIASIAGDVNPYEGNNVETNSIQNVTRLVARNIPNLHQDTFNNVDGKQVYSYVLPTFLNKKLQELKTEEGLNQYLNNWWFKNNAWLQAMKESDLVREQFGLVILDGLLQENKQGVKYYNMVDTQLDISDINMFDNNGSNSLAYYRLPILSDSPQAPYLRFKKFSQPEVITALYNLALSEKDRIVMAQNTDIKIKNWNDDRANGTSYQFLPFLNDDKIDVSSEDDTKRAITRWLEEEFKVEETRLKNNDVLTKQGAFNDSVSSNAARNKDFLRNYFYNKVLANAMITQLTSVDLAFYKDYDDFQKRNGQIFKFTKMIDTEANWRGYTPEKTYTSIFLKDEIIKSELKDFVYDDLIKKGYDKDYAKKVSDAYDNVNQTDAQSYITIDRYRKIKIGVGEWTDTHEDAYKLIKKGKAWDDSYNLLFQPIKPFYYNHHLIPNTDLLTPMQNKNSEAVLLPNLANKSKTLKALLKYMNDNNVDSVQFVSAVKAGEYGAVSSTNLNEATIHTLDNKYYGIQQETPEHHIDTDNLFGSQLRKLAIADIPTETKFGNYTKEEYIDKYHQLLTKNIIDSYNDIEGEFKDIRKIQKLLLEQVIERNLGESFENALQIVKDPQGNEVFNLPLYHPIHAKRFESILNSLVRSSVTKQKINGGNFVLMSNFGFTNELKVVTNKETGAVEYMEVMLPPWTKKWFPRKPNGEVDFDLINKEAPDILNLFGYRIPTEHKYSMKKLKVVGFTPDIMGGIAMLPAEITKIAGEDFDIDKMYVMIPNFESKDGRLQKVKYNLDDIDSLTKEQRDNALIDIISTIWSHPVMSDQILIPGGFDNLSRLAKEMRNINMSSSYANPILPGTQMEYFQRNTNGSKLIGIAANQNTNHAISQYTDMALVNPIEFDDKKLTELNKLKSLDNKLISRNLAEFLAAFVDNAKDPVANDLNLNTFTFDTVATIVRLGYSLDTAIYFVNQPIVKAYTKQYYKAGGTRSSETKAYNLVKDALTKNRKLEVEPKVYSFTTDRLRSTLFIEPGTTLGTIDDERATQQLKVLYTFQKYKEQANSLAKVVRSTKADTLGTRKTIAGNATALRDVNDALTDKNLTGVNEIFIGDKYPLVKVSTEYGLRKPQEELLSIYFPYNKIAYTSLYDVMTANKGRQLSEDEVNYINNTTLVYYTSGFDFFKQSEKSAFVNQFPKYFLKFKDNIEINKFDFMRYLRFVAKGTNNSIDKIEFSSAATISNEQREILTRSWDAMLSSDNPEIAKLARDLVKYSFHTNGLSFTYAGFSHLIPSDYLDKLVDTQGVTFRDYLHKLQLDSQNPKLFDNLIEQIYRHDDQKGLIPRLNEEDIENKISSKKLISSVILAPTDTEPTTKYFKLYNPNGKIYVYKYSGTTSTKNPVYNIIETLGEGNITEYSLDSIPKSVIAINNLPTFSEKDFYATTDQSSPGQEYYQIKGGRDLEIKYELVDALGQYKKYGKEGNGASSTKVYKKLIEDLAKINKDIRGTGYKALPGKTVLDGKTYWIGQIVEEFAQIEGEAMPNNELNDYLKAWFNKLGGKVEYYEDLKQRTGNDVTAIADIGNKLISISKKDEGLDTLPEEIGHFAEAYGRGTLAHSKLLDLVTFTPEYQITVEQYGEIYKNNELKLKQETIGKLIGKAIIKKYEDTKVNNIILTYLKKLWNDFISLFRNQNEVTYRQEIEDITGKIAEDILSGNIDILPTSVTIDGKFYQLTTNVGEKAEEILKTGIDATYKKIKLYERKALTEFTERERQLLAKLSSDLDKKKYQRGLLNYTINAKRELRKIVKRYEKINRNPETLEDKRNTLKTLNQMNNYVLGFKDTLDSIAKSDVFQGPTSEMKLVSRFISETAELVNKLHAEYYNIGKPILVNILREFSTNPNENISQALDILEKDITFTQRFLDQLAEADDSILNIIDVMVKDAKHRGRLKTLEITKILVKAQKILESKGVPSTQFMYERDFSGKLTGRLISEYNIGEFDKQKRKYFELNPRPKQEDYINGSEFTTALHEYNIKIGKWFQDNTQTHPDKDQIIKNKKEELAKQYTNPKLAEQKYNEWFEANTRQSNYYDPIIKEYKSDTRYIKELAVPAEKYRSEQYSSMLANAAMKEYYNLIEEQLRITNSNLPETYKLDGYLPQVRKDFYDRLYIQDADGKKRLKNIKDIGKETKTTLADQLVRREDDVQYGLTDENNIPINMLPVYFTRRLENMDNLSLDLTSNMVAFLYSANDFSEMSKIIDTLEYAKDVVAERDVKTGKFDPVTIFKKKDEKGKPIIKEGKDSMAYQRLEDYMTMTVYGQANKNEGSIGGIDKGKLVDFINTYTSLNSLALNIYSGISNITVGNAMTRMEAIAGEFVNNGDLLQATKIYTSELPATLANIGQRLQTAKLDLWLEYMDTMQNYDREYRDIDAGRNTVFSRVMKVSSLYFINHAGEHWLQSRTSLALANNTKVKDKDGNIISLWDAFEVQDNKLVMKQGITKVAGDRSTSLFRKEEEGQALTERDIIRFINRQNFLNKRMHGIYNNIDKSAIQQYALGRLVIMFRKFIKPGWNRRFAKYTYNEEGEAFTEGYYTTMGRFVKNMYNEMKEGKFSITKNWNNLTETEKANFFRLATEWAYIIASITAATVLTQFADDDDDNYALNLAAYEAYRMYSELRFYTSFTEMWRIIKSPAPAVYQIDKISRFMQVQNWGKEVERGKYKGLNRFEVGALELLPFGGTYVNFRTPEEQLRFYTNNGISIF